MWGCLAKVAIPTLKRVRIDPKSMDSVFIGYLHNSSAYQFLVYKSKIPNIHKNTIMESRNASFFENVFPYKSKEGELSSDNRTNESVRDSVHDETSNDKVQSGNEEINKDIDEPRRSKRARTSKSFGPDFLTFLMESEPQSFKEAVNSPEGPL